MNAGLAADEQSELLCASRSPRLSIGKPVEGRVGFVGTLSHPPSRHALELVLEELKNLKPAAPFEFRIVGSPRDLGEIAAETLPIN